MKRALAVATFIIIATAIATTQQTGTPNQLRVLVDANGYLVTAGATQTLPLSQPTLFSNARLRTDATGALVITTGGGGAGSFTNVSASGQFLAADGTAAAPSYSFTSQPGMGLWREAANVLSLSGGTNAQTFRLYNTYTDASNWERVGFTWAQAANRFRIESTKAGSGTARAIDFTDGATAILTIDVASASISTRGIIFNIDNTFDIGASGATRPRNIYVGTNVINGGFVSSGTGATLGYGFGTTGGATQGMAASGTTLVITSGAGPGIVALQDSSGNAATIRLGTKAMIGGVAPTIASGFGGTPSVVASNGTAAFTINVGSGAAATGGVITMPAATTGWACAVNDITNPALFITDQTATSTTSVTVANYSRTTGLLVAWSANDIIQLACLGY